MSDVVFQDFEAESQEVWETVLVFNVAKGSFPNKETGEMINFSNVFVGSRWNPFAGITKVRAVPELVAELDSYFPPELNGTPPLDKLPVPVLARLAKVEVSQKDKQYFKYTRIREILPLSSSYLESVLQASNAHLASAIKAHNDKVSPKSPAATVLEKARERRVS